MRCPLANTYAYAILCQACSPAMCVMLRASLDTSWHAVVVEEVKKGGPAAAVGLQVGLLPLTPDL